MPCQHQVQSTCCKYQLSLLFLLQLIQCDSLELICKNQFEVIQLFHQPSSVQNKKDLTYLQYLFLKLGWKNCLADFLRQPHLSIFHLYLMSLSKKTIGPLESLKRGRTKKKDETEFHSVEEFVQNNLPCRRLDS